MSSQKGCKFCIRHGLPVLPVRPAVMAIDDTLPHLPASINVPVEAQGETAWTARLLREGFLYIWAESGKRWINYFATSEGYYYPLPEDGDVPPDVINGKRKPCITQPTELASASLITLPVKSAGMKNGVFWFCWSEVEWTAAVRKKHEDAAYRSQFMQRFDLDAWIKSGQAAQVIALSALTDTVAEYSIKASAANVKEWSVAPWKSTKPKEGMNLLSAANRLFPDKGAMVFLQDPVAVAQDVSWLANSRLNRKFYENPEYTRELALTAAVHGLKDSICAQYERDIVLGEKIEESIIKAGYEDPTGESSLGALVVSILKSQRDVITLEKQVDKKWHAEYGKYYDKSKEDAFTRAFNDEIKNMMRQLLFQ